VRAAQIARTGYLATQGLIPDATSKSLVWTARYPFGAATFAAPGQTAIDIRSGFAVLSWMVEVWRAIQNKTANSYTIEIIM
jgi:hypothetical protein